MRRSVFHRKSYSGSRATSASVFGPGAGARVRVAAAAVGAARCRRRRRRSSSAAAAPTTRRIAAAAAPAAAAAGCASAGQRERGVVERRGARLAQVDVAPAAAVVQHLERAALAVGLAERAGAGGAARRQRVGVGRALGGERRAERRGRTTRRRRTGSAPRRRRTAGAARRAAAAAAAARPAAAAPPARREAAAAAPTPTRSARTRPGSRCSCSRRATCRDLESPSHIAPGAASSSASQVGSRSTASAAGQPLRTSLRQSPPHSGETCLSITGIAACPTRGERVGGLDGVGNAVDPAVASRGVGAARSLRAAGLHTIPQYTQTHSRSPLHTTRPHGQLALDVCPAVEAAARRVGRRALAARDGVAARREDHLDRRVHAHRALRAVGARRRRRRRRRAVGRGGEGGLHAAALRGVGGGHLGLVEAAAGEVARPRAVGAVAKRLEADAREEGGRARAARRRSSSPRRAA